MKVKRDWSVIRLFLEINFETTISMKRSRPELSIDVVIGLAFKNNTPFICFDIHTQNRCGAT